MEGWTSDGCGKRFNGNVTVRDDRSAGEASTRVRARRRAVRMKENERLSCIVPKGRPQM